MAETTKPYITVEEHEGKEDTLSFDIDSFINNTDNVEMAYDTVGKGINSFNALVDDLADISKWTDTGEVNMTEKQIDAFVKEKALTLNNALNDFEKDRDEDKTIVTNLSEKLKNKDGLINEIKQIMYKADKGFLATLAATKRGNKAQGPNG